MSSAASLSGRTTHGFPGPTDVVERRNQEREVYVTIHMTQHEKRLLHPGRSGVLGRFCLLENDDGTYELVRYADD